VFVLRLKLWNQPLITTAGDTSQQNFTVSHSLAECVADEHVDHQQVRSSEASPSCDTSQGQQTIKMCVNGPSYLNDGISRDRRVAGSEGVLASLGARGLLP
jgi:hypothetical protein